MGKIYTEALICMYFQVYDVEWVEVICSLARSLTRSEYRLSLCRRPHLYSGGGAGACDVDRYGGRRGRRRHSFFFFSFFLSSSFIHTQSPAEEATVTRATVTATVTVTVTVAVTVTVTAIVTVTVTRVAGLGRAGADWMGIGAAMGRNHAEFCRKPFDVKRVPRQHHGRHGWLLFFRPWRRGGARSQCAYISHLYVRRARTGEGRGLAEGTRRRGGACPLNWRCTIKKQTNKNKDSASEFHLFT